MIVFNGVPLNGSLQWTDRHQFAPVAQSATRTLGGKMVVYSAPLVAGRPITLTATEDTGWLQKTMVDAIVAAAGVPGQAYDLEVHGETFRVIFRHEEPPAVDFTPLQPKAYPAPTDYYIGTFKLITIQ